MSATTRAAHLQKWKGPVIAPGLSCGTNLSSRLCLAATAAWATAAATATTRPTTTTTAIVVVTNWRTSCADRLANSDRCTLNTIEVRLILLVELLAAFFLKVVTTLNQNSALVRFRLALVKLVVGPRRRRGKRRFRGADFADFRFCGGRLRKLGLLLLDESFPAKLDAIAFDGPEPACCI